MGKKILNIGIVIITIIFAVIIVYLIFLINDNNSSTIQNYSTIVLAFLTYFYVLLTYLILKSNNRSIQEQLRPYVSVTFPIQSEDLILLIQNFGKRPAYEVNIKIEPELTIYQDSETKGNYKTYLNQNFIAPNQKFHCYITDASDIISDQGKDLEKLFKISLQYKDSENNNYPEAYYIDLSTIISGNDVIKQDTSHFLEGIYSELGKLNKKLDLFLMKK